MNKKAGRPARDGVEPYDRLLLRLPKSLLKDIDAQKEALEKKWPMLGINRALLIRLGISWVANASDEDIVKGMTGKKPD